MKKIFLFLILVVSFEVIAQDAALAIKREFDSVQDLSRQESFKRLMGTKYICDEFDWNWHKAAYDHFKTKLGFKNVATNSYGDDEGEINYLEFNKYLRNDDFLMTPTFGCDGIDNGLNYDDEVPYLYIMNMVTRLGNTNLGSCYDFHFKISGSSIVAIGLHREKIMHAMKCQRVNNF